MFHLAPGRSFTNLAIFGDGIDLYLDGFTYVLVILDGLHSQYIKVVLEMMLLGLVYLRLTHFFQLLYLYLLRVVGSIVGLQANTVFAGE